MGSPVLAPESKRFDENAALAAPPPRQHATSLAKLGSVFEWLDGIAGFDPRQQQRQEGGALGGNTGGGDKEGVGASDGRPVKDLPKMLLFAHHRQGRGSRAAIVCAYPRILFLKQFFVPRSLAQGRDAAGTEPRGRHVRGAGA